jgi:hypothetical protein
LALQRLDSGWFEVDVACTAGTSYRYKLVSGQAVPDLASRMQAKDVQRRSVGVLLA